MAKKKKRKTSKEIEQDIEKRKEVLPKSPNGKNIAFIFSCPGKEELKSNEYLSGETGENFKKLLEHLHTKYPDIFEYTSKEKYHIDNSSIHVYYKGYLDSNRTTPYHKDIKSSSNLKRLEENLGNMQYIISFGKDAKLALDSLGIKYIDGLFHLSNINLNSNKKLQNFDNLDSKLKHISQHIIEAIKKVDSVENGIENIDSSHEDDSDDGEFPTIIPA